MTRPHPIQPLELDDRGVLRFKANAIVRYLLDNGGISMNDLAVEDFTREDREQFAQLIGYSHSGSGDLSYVSDAVWYAAQDEYEARTDAESPAGTARGSEEVMTHDRTDAELAGPAQRAAVARGEEGKTSPLIGSQWIPPDVPLFGQGDETKGVINSLDVVGTNGCKASIETIQRTCTHPTCRAEMRPGLHCDGPNCPLRK